METKTETKPLAPATSCLQVLWGPSRGGLHHSEWGRGEEGGASTSDARLKAVHLIL